MGVATGPSKFLLLLCGFLVLLKEKLLVTSRRYQMWGQDHSQM
jgi:hypothetical protein